MPNFKPIISNHKKFVLKNQSVISASEVDKLDCNLREGYLPSVWQMLNKTLFTRQQLREMTQTSTFNCSTYHSRFSRHQDRSPHYIHHSSYQYILHQDKQGNSHSYKAGQSSNVVACQEDIVLCKIPGKVVLKESTSSWMWKCSVW